MTDSHPITCDDCQSLLEEFALDALPVEPCARVAKHLASGCPVCTQQLSELVCEYAQLAQALPMERPTMRVDRVLRERIAAGRLADSANAATVATERTTISSKWATRGLIAAAAALAAAILGIAAFTTPRGGANGGSGGGGLWAELQRRVEQADASQKFPEIPQLHFASLGKRQLATPVDGYVIEDRLAKQWHVYAFHLPKLQNGHAYHIWFDMGNSRFVRAGAANVDEDGTVQRLVDAPSDSGPVQGIAISEESSPNVDRPTGDSLVEAKLPR